VVPKQIEIGDKLEVFIYFDSDDKIIATTKRARAQVGECALLKVIDVNRVGAFLDWGLDKDLLVPKSEQYRPMEKDKSYIVHVKQDQQDRIIASSKLDYYLNKLPPRFKEGDEVVLLIAETTSLGKKVIINHTHWGLLYSSDIFQPLSHGEITKGYIKSIRDDGKIDVALRLLGADNIQALAHRILEKLNEHGGYLPLHDKSPPEAIYSAFGESKKSFKNAIGYLYKRKDIRIDTDGIRSVQTRG
jgi:predicted RNA-binding protein (virulence factor B family)